MPGFMVRGVGGHRSIDDARREYYYNYYWEVVNLFESSSQQGSGVLVGLKDASLPTFTVNKETYMAASLEYKFAKSVSWDDVKVSWYDHIGLLKTMKEWRSNVWSPECGLSDANHYKRRSLIEYYLPTGEKTCGWILRNSWPSQIRHGELTYTSSDVKLIEVTITYDWAEERPAN